MVFMPFQLDSWEVFTLSGLASFWTKPWSQLMPRLSPSPVLTDSHWDLPTRAPSDFQRRKEEKTTY